MASHTAVVDSTVVRKEILCQAQDGTLQTATMDCTHSTCDSQPQATLCSGSGQTEMQQLEAPLQKCADDLTCRPIIVTGFGPLSHYFEDNLSKDVMQEFYRMNGGVVLYNSEQIPILTGSPPMMKNNLQPIEASYKFITSTSTSGSLAEFDHWLKCTDARLSVHLGIKGIGNEILFEKQASNGYAGFWRPDGYGTTCYDGSCIPEGPTTLKTDFKILDLIDSVTEKKLLNTHLRDVNLTLKRSTDADNFLCDFLYYRSLFYSTQRDTGAKNVILIHIPIDLPDGVTTRDMAELLDLVVHSLLDMTCLHQREAEEEKPLSDHEVTKINGHRMLTEFNGVENRAGEEGGVSKRLIEARPYHGCDMQASPNSYYQPPYTANQEILGNQQKILGPLKQAKAIENTIVVTSSDPISGKSPNQSWKIVQKFRSLFQQKDGVIEYNSIPFQLVTCPPGGQNRPVTATYDYLTSHDFDNWLKSSNALLYIHLGTSDTLNAEAGNTFSFERIAMNGQAEYWGADTNSRRVSGPCMEGGEKFLCTQFSDQQLNELISHISAEVRGEKINGTFAFKQSTDVGNSLHDFLYYRSLYYANSRNGTISDGRKSYVISIQVPSKLKPNNLAGIVPMALVLNLIVHNLLNIIAQ